VRIEIKEPKTAIEKLDYVIDLTDELKQRGQNGEDDAISAADWTVPISITKSGAYITDFFCGAFLAGGAVGKNNVDVKITTRDGRIYDVRLVITVKNNT
jgi:hypothetical protein